MPAQSEANINLITLPATILDTAWDRQKIASSRKQSSQTKKMAEIAEWPVAQIGNLKVSWVPHSLMIP